MWLEDALLWLEAALLPVVSAMLDHCLELPAGVALMGLLARRQRAEPIEPFDVGSALVFCLLVFVLVRRVVRSPVRSLAGIGRMYRIPKGTEGPTAGWAHFGVSGFWLFVGIQGWDVFGPGIAIMAGSLMLFRGAVRLKRALE